MAVLRLKSNTIIIQQPSKDFPKRDKVFIFSFLHECEIVSGWQIMTDTAKITIPKKLYFKDGAGNRVNFDGKDIIGNSATDPVLMRGDRVKITLGYIYNTPEEREVNNSNMVFDGFISKITNRIPLEIECEDRMWQLKQIKTPNKVYSNKNYTVQKMIAEMLSLQPETRDITLITGSLVGQKIETNIGAEFRTQDETIGGVLARLAKEARVHSYFRNVDKGGVITSELRCSGIVYYPSDRVVSNFGFQQNIISDNLEWKRKEDLKLGATVYSVNKEEIDAGLTKSGKQKTKRKRLETFVGEKEGELRTLYFWDVHTEKELKELGTRELRKFYYTGFSGSFLTFGLPKVKHGDEVVLNDKKLPERNGQYLVKAVTTTFGMGGFRQDVSLHLKLGPWSEKEIKDKVNITEAEINNGL